MYFGIVFLTAMLALAAPAMAQVPTARQATGLSIEEMAEQRVWSDEHARWNAQHLAAARRLETIVAAFRSHDSNFDIHGLNVRRHPAKMTGQDSRTAARLHAEMRAEHEEARSAHHHLMTDVDALAAVMSEKFTESVTPLK